MAFSQVSAATPNSDEDQYIPDRNPTVLRMFLYINTMPPPGPLVPTAHGFPITHSAAADFVGAEGFIFCHTNAFPDFTHVTVAAPDLAVAPIFVHFVPGVLLAANALAVEYAAITRNESVAKKILLFILRNNARLRRSSIVCLAFRNFECEPPSPLNSSGVEPSQTQCLAHPCRHLLWHYGYCAGSWT